jgi:hypothetical protein
MAKAEGGERRVGLLPWPVRREDPVPSLGSRTPWRQAKSQRLKLPPLLLQGTPAEPLQFPSLRSLGWSAGPPLVVRLTTSLRPQAQKATPPVKDRTWPSALEGRTLHEMPPAPGGRSPRLSRSGGQVPSPSLRAGWASSCVYRSGSCDAAPCRGARRAGGARASGPGWCGGVAGRHLPAHPEVGGAKACQGTREEGTVSPCGCCRRGAWAVRRGAESGGVGGEARMRTPRQHGTLRRAVRGCSRHAWYAVAREQPRGSARGWRCAQSAHSSVQVLSPLAVDEQFWRSRDLFGGAKPGDFPW